MTLSPGARLSHYRVVAALGAGGMGEVYRATDTKLERDVAIKVLPEDLSDDADRLARFEREAKLLASLNHPNIASTYRIEDAGEISFHAIQVTMEGREFRGRLPRVADWRESRGRR